MNDVASQRPTRGNLRSANCPSRLVLQHMTSRWGALILLTLQGNTLRFGELRRAVGGISDRTLAQTLQVLEGDGLVCRKDYKQIPPKVEYSLTPLGEDATETLRPLADWIETNLSQIAKHWS